MTDDPTRGQTDTIPTDDEVALEQGVLPDHDEDDDASDDAQDAEEAE